MSQTGEQRAPWQWRRRPLSARTRILTAVVGLAALALFVCGYTVYYLQLMQVEDRINAELEADAQEFIVLHEEGVDPVTGAEWASPSDLVRTAMSRIIPTRNEGAIGMAAGEIAWTSPVTDINLEEDPELLALLADYAVADRAQFTTISTDQTTYRAVVVPVHAETEVAEGQSSGHEVAAFVMAYDLTAERAAFSGIFLTYAAVAVLSLLVVALVGYLVAGRLLHPVRLLAETSRRITQEDLTERIPVSGSDDVAAMTRSVNEMLDRLEGAFTAQEQLIHDVSHELRTPLTILRGHLEVLDAGDPEDVNATRELTLDELKRMNRVVDDLTTLAQADRPDFVQPAEVELGTLTDEIYDKVLALGDRKWLIVERAEGAAVLDRERITQALLQLAANAVKFSPPGSVVALGSRVEGDDVVLSIRDQGAGIPEAHQQRIFERFQRSDTSQPGSGLGLPIVKAIAAAHSGSVQVKSQESAGTTFSLILPDAAVGVGQTLVPVLSADDPTIEIPTEESRS